MRIFFLRKKAKVFLIFFLIFFSFLNAQQLRSGKEEASSALSLLPEVSSWKLADPPQVYFSETLFEYIDGAAEIYLSYDFKELIVAQYKKENARSSLTIEIYDMGNEKNSFGIYSAERFPGSQFLSIGNQGYGEEGALNFVTGKNYVKLFCFDCGEDSEKILELFAQEIVKRVQDRGSLPAVLRFFPREGLIPNSEKFILRNFMGFSFLHNGYIANYERNGLEFDCFYAEGKTGEEAESMVGQYLSFYAQKNELVQKIPLGYHLRDRHSHHTYLARVENFVCGVTRIKDGFEGIGEKYLEMLVSSLKK